MRINTKITTFSLAHELTCIIQFGERILVMFYHTLVQAIVLYNAETWTLKEEHKRKLSVFEMSVLRRICGITRRDRRRNIDIKQDLGVTLDIVQRVQRRRLTYFRHVARMDNNRYPNIPLHGYGSGQRPRGRPKKSGLIT